MTVRRLGVQWHLDLKEGIDLAIYLSCYERNTLKRYRDLVSPGATILDIGANIGVHALHLAYLVGTQGRVYAVEPTSFAYDKLLDNLGLNPDITERVITCQSMLLASDEATLPEEAVSSWPLTDDAVLTTALAGSPRSTGGARLETLDGLTARMGIESLDLIKIDVDGYELDVLRGGEKTIARDAPSIVLEICPHLGGDHTFAELIAWIRDSGFAMYDLVSDASMPLDPDRLERSIPWGAGKNVLLRHQRRA